MAERTATAIPGPGYRAITWTGILNGDTGSWFDTEDFADRTFQVSGTFGAGGSVTMQGSNDASAPTNVFTLTDQAGAALTFTAAGGKVALEAPRWVRPTCTAGDGTTSLTVQAIARR